MIEQYVKKSDVKQRGFTLIEILITMVILAVIASLAAPSFISTIRKNQLSQQTTIVLESLTQARTNALLTKNTKNVNYTLDADKVEWSNGKQPNQLRFTYMGFVEGTDHQQCFILQHRADTNLKRYILLAPNGVVSSPRHLTDCPT